MHMLKHMDIGAPPSANYDILVSVFHPRPDQQKVRWNVRAAIESKNHTDAATHPKQSSIKKISISILFLSHLLSLSSSICQWNRRRFEFCIEIPMEISGSIRIGQKTGE